MKKADKKIVITLPRTATLRLLAALLFGGIVFTVWYNVKMNEFTPLSGHVEEEKAIGYAEALEVFNIPTRVQEVVRTYNVPIESLPRIPSKYWVHVKRKDYDEIQEKVMQSGLFQMRLVELRERFKPKEDLS